MAGIGAAADATGMNNNSPAAASAPPVAKLTASVEACARAYGARTFHNELDNGVLICVCDEGLPTYARFARIGGQWVEVN